MNIQWRSIIILLFICAVCVGFVGTKKTSKRNRVNMIPASATMVTAWDVPMNPLADSSLEHSSPLAEQIRWGFRLFIDTPREAARFSPNKLSCNNCHVNAGQKEKALPLVGIAGIYPEYNKRDGRLFSLEDRIVGCFKRSLCAVGVSRNEDSLAVGKVEIPSSDCKEILALAAYLTWLSQGFPLGEDPPWRGHNVIAKENLIPIGKLDARRGEALFLEKCSNCHGADGQGVEIGDKKAGPLWGSDSWNDGAGAARIYTLAGIIRYAMPYLDPGSLTDEEAQHISAFINSKPRPAYPFKDLDYRVEKLPIDAVYYKR